MTKDQKLNSIIESYWHSNLTLYQALDKAYMEGSLEILAKYQNEIDNHLGTMNNVLDKIQEIANGK